MGRIIDISQMLSPGMAVWPGDAEFKPFWTGRIEETGSVNIGGVSMSLHTGTHVDSPRHFNEEGMSIAEVDLDAFVGEAQVIDLAAADPKLLSVGITPEMIFGVGETKRDISAPRILLKTGTGGAAGMFPEAFAHLTEDAARALVGMGVRLIGIDTPSIERVDAKDMAVHKILAEGSVAILENLALSHVEAGRYELIALPLKFSEMDASPVRAVLREIV